MMLGICERLSWKQNFMANKITKAAPKVSRLPLPDRDEDAFHSAQESHDARGHQSTSKTREVLSLLATAILPIIGALGTLFVFLVVNFYVGDVDVAIPNGYQTLEVHAYNQKGQDAVFHTPHFQLMPDRYHFEVSVNGKPREHADAAVKFRHSTKVILIASASAANGATVEQSASEQTEQPKTHSKHFWQFWKKSSDN
jgi:hypothetical protein